VTEELVDWHSHVWLAPHLGNEWGPQLDENVQGRPSEAGDYAAHEAARRAAGITHSVVVALTSDLLGLDIPNSFIAEYVALSDGAIVGFGSVDPNRANAVEQVIAAASMGLSGIKLSPPYQGFHPHSEDAWHVYKAAADLGLVLMFHQGGVFTPRGMLEYANPVLLDKVARSFADTRIIIAHMGQPWVNETVALLFKNPNVFADLSARFSRPWQLRNILFLAMDYGVTGKLLFGSDFPIFDPAACITQFKEIVDSPTEESRARHPSLPRIPSAVVDEILSQRPLSLMGLA